jgi:hypothetical protein
MTRPSSARVAMWRARGKRGGVEAMEGGGATGLCVARMPARAAALTGCVGTMSSHAALIDAVSFAKSGIAVTP